MTDYKSREEFERQRREETDCLRAIPLEELALSFGMKRDRYDKRKWRLDGMRVSISDEQQFYDHSTQKGGTGAIDFIQYVKELDFNGARKLLLDGYSSALPPVSFSNQHSGSLERSSKPTRPKKTPRFQKPYSNPLKWKTARSYLISDRFLPAELVDALSRNGDVYATGLPDKTLRKQIQKGNLDAHKIVNVVFLMRDPFDRSVVKGAALRAASTTSQFKGMAEGSSKQEGWFYFDWGNGDRVSKVVLVESAIDAMSAAALSHETEHSRIRFLSTAGEGAIPLTYLDQCAEEGVAIVAGFNNDKVGWKLVVKVAQRYPIRAALPPHGNDWNEALEHFF
ncbi:MAG: DUF3991 domain-containing protein [Cyanobacteria bacterium J06642_2]